MNLEISNPSKDVVKTMEYLEEQVVEAENLAEHMANPAVGFLRAMRTIDHAFEGLRAPTIIAMLQAVMFRILNKRVMELQEQAEEDNEDEDAEDDGDTPKGPDVRPVKKMILKKQCIIRTREAEGCTDCGNRAFCDPFSRK